MSTDQPSVKRASTQRGHRWLLASAILLSLAILSAGGAWWYHQALDRAFRHAAFYGNASTARALLMRGARIDSRDRGVTALAVAADSGHTEVVRLLLEHGADVNGRVIEGHTPLTMAAYSGRTECVRLLIAGGADVNAHGSPDNHPLIGAVMNGHSEIVTLLLQAGADVGVHDRSGRSLMYRAKLSLRSLPSRRAALTETIRILRVYGAKD